MLNNVSRFGIGQRIRNKLSAVLTPSVGKTKSIGRCDTLESHSPRMLLGHHKQLRFPRNNRLIMSSPDWNLTEVILGVFAVVATGVAAQAQSIFLQRRSKVLPSESVAYCAVTNLFVGDSNGLTYLKGFSMNA